MKHDEADFRLRRIYSHTHSAKIAALMTHLRRTRRDDLSRIKSERDQHHSTNEDDNDHDIDENSYNHDPPFTGTRSVVFSQFTGLLDLLEPSLQRDQIPFLRFDGSMSQPRRAEVLRDFARDSTTITTLPTPIKSSLSYSSTTAKPPTQTIRAGLVLLLSLRAGGVGLNLTHAQHVYMLDPWWSYAVEAQAIDRVHRMGQTRAVQVTRFIVRDSVEERMLRIQERKRFLASSLGMMSDDEKRAQSVRDMRELLS